MVLPVFIWVIVALINGIISAIFGLLTWFNNPKRKVNQLLGLMCLSITIWAISWAIQAPIQERASALFWARMLNFGAIFIPVFFLHWVLVLLDIEKKNKTILALSYLLTIFFALISFTPYFVETVKIKPYFLYYSEPGILHPFYLLFCYGGMVGYAIYNLLKSYKKVTDYKKAQIKYVVLGTALGFGGGATAYFLWYGVSIPPFGTPLVAVGFGLLTYSIVCYRLMDIRWILGRTGVYLLSFSIIILYSLSLSYLNQRFGSVIPGVGLIIFISVTIVLLFLYFFRFFERLAGKYFYYTYYNLKLTLQRLGKQLNQTIELDKLTSLINRSLLDALQLDKVGIVLRGIKEKTFYPQVLIKYKKEDIASILTRDQSFLLRYLQQTQKPLIKEEIPFLLREEKEEQRNKLLSLQEEMERTGVRLFLPFFIGKELIGMVILGNKISGEPYTVQDLELLSTLAAQVSVALNNALSYEEIKKRKADLEKFYKLTVGRELRMVELKKEIKKLEKRLKKKKEV